MECKKCGSQQVVLKQDSRGIPEAYCAECEHYIKKMSTAEVIEFYEEKLKNLSTFTSQVVEESKKTEDKAMCKYCTEPIFKRVNRISYAELTDAKFCPMCGREKKPTDKNY